MGRTQLTDNVGWFVGAIGDSEYNSAELVAANYHPVVTIPMLVDLEKTRTAPWDQAIVTRYQNTFNLLFIGRIVENKKQHELVELFAHFKALYRRPAKLMLIGGTTSIDYEQYLQAVIAEHHL